MKTLVGKSILVTRPRHQAGALAESLQRLGAKVHLMPAIEIAPLKNTRAIDNALKNLGSYDWVVLTSVNGVLAVTDRLNALGIPFINMSAKNIAAIGPATAAAIETYFRAPDLVPEEYVSEAIAVYFEVSSGGQSSKIKGQKFFLARADIARRDLAHRLRALGAEVDEVAAYRIVRPSHSELPNEVPDAITLSSAEAARSTYSILQDAGKESWMHSADLICIGPITANAVRTLGFEPSAVAERYTADGLLDAIVKRIGRAAAHA